MIFLVYVLVNMRCLGGFQSNSGIKGIRARQLVVRFQLPLLVTLRYNNLHDYRNLISHNFSLM